MNQRQQLIVRIALSYAYSNLEDVNDAYVDGATIPKLTESEVAELLNTFVLSAADNFPIFKAERTLVWDELWRAMKTQWQDDPDRICFSPNIPDNPEWVETTEDMYDDQLNAIPPTRMVSNAFLGGEPWSHAKTGEPVFCAFCRRKDWDGKMRVYATYLTTKMFEARFGKRN